MKKNIVAKKIVRLTRISNGATRIINVSCDDLAKLLFRCDGLIIEVLA